MINLTKTKINKNFIKKIFVMIFRDFNFSVKDNLFELFYYI